MCSNTCVNVIELDYVVLKLNGNDITSLSNCEAVQMFLQAKENLIVELFRKKTPTENTYDVRGIIPSEEVATCGKFKENIEILNKETCASTNINSNSNTAYASQKKSKIVLTLRAIINSDHNVPALDDIDLPPNAQSKETQTIEDYQLHVPDSRHNENIVKTIADHFIEQEHHLFEHCLEPEIDIEEVTLIKKDSSSSEPLGITVCGNDFFKEYDESFKPVITSEDAANEANLEENVFISEIQADSLAEKDGRLRRGDQVLRINGIDIKSKKHAETVFTENGTSVTLLVSRILYPDEEDENDDDDDDEDDEDDDIDSNFVYANRFLTDDYTNVVDKLEKVLLAQQNSMPPANKSQLESKPHPETLANSEGNKSKSITSSISKAQSDSVSNQLAVTRVPPINPPNNKQQYDYDDSEHIYETIPEDSESEPLYCSPYQSSNYITACSSADVLKMQQQTQRVAQWLGIKHQQISSRTAHTLAGRPSVYTKHIQQRLSHRVCTLRSAITSTSRSSSSGAANSACGLNNIDTDINNQNHNLNHNQLHEEVENSSSAYNTGGSNNSASPRQNLNLENDNFTSSIVTTTPKTQSKETFLISPINRVLMLPFGKTSRILYPTSSSALNHIYAQDNNPVQNKVISDAVQPSTASPSAKPESKQMRAKLLEEQQVQCPQFNAPNLSRYHFVSSKEAASKRMSGATSSSVFVNHDNAEEVPMVWKVKRRPDGSRYIVKRPARSHVNQVEIRRNVEKIKQDDDVISDLKLGRYWTKEERRRHIERAREKRQLQHQVQPQQQ